MSDHICECCGQTRPPTIDVPSLKGKSRKIFELIRGAGKAGINSERLVGLIYQDDPDGGPLFAIKCIHVLIHRVNRVHLKESGYVIKGEHTGGHAFGSYRLVKCEVAA